MGDRAKYSALFTPFPRQTIRHAPIAEFGRISFYLLNAIANFRHRATIGRWALFLDSFMGFATRRFAPFYTSGAHLSFSHIFIGALKVGAISAPSTRRPVNRGF